MSASGKDVAASAVASVPPSPIGDVQEKKPLKKRIRELVWDSFDRSPQERHFIAKIDFFILTWAGFSYFSKNLNSNNLCEYRHRGWRCCSNCRGSKCVRVGDEGRAKRGREPVPDFHHHVDDVRIMRCISGVFANDLFSGYVISQIPSQITCTRGIYTACSLGGIWTDHVQSACLFGVPVGSFSGSSSRLPAPRSRIRINFMPAAFSCVGDPGSV